MHLEIVIASGGPPRTKNPQPPKQPSSQSGKNQAGSSNQLQKTTTQSIPERPTSASADDMDVDQDGDDVNPRSDWKSKGSLARPQRGDVGEFDGGGSGEDDGQKSAAGDDDEEAPNEESGSSGSEYRQDDDDDDSNIPPRADDDNDNLPSDTDRAIDTKHSHDKKKGKKKPRAPRNSNTSKSEGKSRPKAANYDSVIRTLLERTWGKFRTALSLDDAFPYTTSAHELAEYLWSDTCKNMNHEEHEDPDPAYVTIVSFPRFYLADST